MIEVKVTSLTETHEAAKSVAEAVQPGDLILLVGDLGAGKTAFTQGFGKALGVHEVITSPTFTLAREYQGTMQIHHLDVYRIDQIEEVRDLALPELFEGNSVTLIEWGDQIISALPKDHLEISFEYADADNDRFITIRANGSEWNSRVTELKNSLEIKEVITSSSNVEPFKERCTKKSFLSTSGVSGFNISI